MCLLQIKAYKRTQVVLLMRHMWNSDQSIILSRLS